MPQASIPLAAPYNTRKIASAIHSGSGSYAGYATAGVAIAGSSGSSSTKDQRYVNLVPESISLGDAGGIFYLTPRPGFATHTTPATGNVGSALHIWAGGSGAIISAFGATNSTLYSATTSLGSVTGVVKWITETDVAGVKTLLFMTDGGRMWYYNATPTLAEITDVDYPPKQTPALTVVGWPVVKNDKVFVMTTSGRIYHSDDQSVTAWTSTAWISTAMSPDTQVALTDSGQYLVAFGTESLEWFVDSGNPGAGSVLTSAKREVGIGCVSADCITTIRDVVYWIGTSDLGGVGIYRLVGVDWQKWSQRELDAVIDVSGTTTLALQSCNVYGQPLLILRVGARTFTVNTENKIISEWEPAGNVLWDRLAGASTGSSLPLYSISASDTGGKVYVVDPTNYVFTDAGTEFSCYIQMAKTHHGTPQRKRGNWLALNADTWTSAGTITVSCSDDDYATTDTLGTIDMTADRKRINRMGMFRERSYILTWTPQGPFRIQSPIYVDVEALAS